MSRAATHRHSSPRVFVANPEDQKSVQSAVDTLQNQMNNLSKSVNNMTRSGDSETHLGKPGDVKINKRGKKQFEMLIRGEDSWYRDANSSYVGMDTPTNFTENFVKTIQSGSDIEHRFKDQPRIRFDLDKSTLTGTAHPKIFVTGNFTLDASGDIELDAGGGDITMTGNVITTGDIYLGSNKKIQFDSSDTTVRTDASDPENLLLEADEDIKLYPDDDVLIHHGTSNYATFKGDERQLAIAPAAIASAADKTGVLISQEINETGTSDDKFYANLELHIKKTDTDSYSDMNYIFCHNAASGEGTGGEGLSSKFRVSSTGAVTAAGALTCTTIDTGQGANEVYDMDQNVKTDSAVTFATVDTGQGANELYDMDQNVKTTDAVTFTTITASTKFDHVMSIQTHAFYITGTSEVYLPFGPSAIEGSSTADSANDDTLFIAPYAGSLEFIKLQTASTGAAPGATRMELRVNGTDGAYVQQTISNETTATFTWSSDNTFSAGDRLRITFDTSAAAKYVSATSVWKYTL